MNVLLQRKWTILAIIAIVPIGFLCQVLYRSCLVLGEQLF